VFDAGVTAFIVNAFISVGVALVSQPSVEEQRRVQERFFTLFNSDTRRSETVPATAPVSSRV
jgi:hypothetical protein